MSEETDPGKTMNRLTRVGRSYRDYISHFRLHSRRSSKPLYPFATRVSSSPARSQLKAWSRWSRLFSNGRRDAILDTDKSCPSFFNTRAILPFRAPTMGESLPSFNGRKQATGDIGRTTISHRPDFSSSASFISRFHP